MDKEVYTFALKNTLNEIRNVCPDIAHIFMFTEDGEIIASDENTNEKMMVQVVDAFSGILERADKIGGVESIILEGSNGRVNVSCINNIYFLTVTSRKADINYVNTITRVIIPTVLRLLDKISPTPLKNAPPSPEIELEIPTFEKLQPAEEEPKETEKPQIELEPVPSETPVNQLIVENLGGLLVPSDTVRIDSTILSRWEALYENRKIEEVEIETFDGKTTRCKVKPIKDSKYEGKGVIQMPEKIQLALEIKKGELVRAKPII